MKKGLTELVFILDRSGSMSGLESDTIGGFNSMLEKQKRETGEALVSVVLFDDRSEVLYDRVDIRKIEPMNDNQYFVRGCTALLDAIGGAIHHIGNVCHKDLGPYPYIDALKQNDSGINDNPVQAIYIRHKWQSGSGL